MAYGAAYVLPSLPGLIASSVLDRKSHPSNFVDAANQGCRTGIIKDAIDKTPANYDVSMQPEISQATQSDIEAILPLLREVQELHVLVEPKRYRSISDHELRINLQNHFHDDKLGCILVARSEQIVAGYLVLLVQTTPDSPFIYKKRFALVDQLGVNISIKRQGIGTALLNAAMSWCAGNGIESIELDVRASNMDAVAFYKACGFEPSNHRMVKSTTD